MQKVSDYIIRIFMTIIWKKNYKKFILLKLFPDISNMSTCSIFYIVRDQYILISLPTNERLKANYHKLAPPPPRN